MTRRYWRKKCPKCKNDSSPYYIVICKCGYNQLKEQEDRNK